MQVSLQSKVYLGTNVAIEAYFAYSNPKRWMTCFAIGVLAGILIGRLIPKRSTSWPSAEKRRKI